MSGEAIPFIAPDYPDDTDAAWIERRQKLRQDLSDAAIEDMLVELSEDRELVGIIRRNNVNKGVCGTPEHIAVGQAVNERITVKVEEYLAKHD